MSEPILELVIDFIECTINVRLCHILILIKILAVLNHRDNHDHNHEAENEDNREYDEQDIEEVWASDPMPSGSYRNQMTLEDDPMEGSSGLNTSVPYANRDTMGYRRYRHPYLHTYIYLTRF